MIDWAFRPCHKCLLWHRIKLLCVERKWKRVRHANSMSTRLLLWRRIKLFCGEEVEECGMPTACQLSCRYGVELNCYVERKWKRAACQQHVNSLAVMA
jgi:hypothetical protein